MWLECILAWITVALLTNLGWLWLPSSIPGYASSEHCTCVRCTSLQTIPIRKLPVLHHDYSGPADSWYSGKDEFHTSPLDFATRWNSKNSERAILELLCGDYLQVWWWWWCWACETMIPQLTWADGLTDIRGSSGNTGAIFCLLTLELRHSNEWILLVCWFVTSMQWARQGRVLLLAICLWLFVCKAYFYI